MKRSKRKGQGIYFLTLSARLRIISVRRGWAPPVVLLRATSSKRQKSNLSFFIFPPPRYLPSPNGQHIPYGMPPRTSFCSHRVAPSFISAVHPMAICMASPCLKMGWGMMILKILIRASLVLSYFFSYCPQKVKFGNALC